MADEFTRAANAGINIIIGLGTAVFVLVLFAIILYNIGNATTNTAVVDKFFGPIESNWKIVALLVMLGAAVMIILPLISRIRGSTGVGAA